jgi:hypothetical protein
METCLLLAMNFRSITLSFIVVLAVFWFLVMRHIITAPAAQIGFLTLLVVYVACCVVALPKGA